MRGTVGSGPWLTRADLVKQPAREIGYSDEEREEGAAYVERSWCAGETVHPNGEQGGIGGVEGLFDEARVGEPPPDLTGQVRGLTGPGPDDGGAGGAQLGHAPRLCGGRRRR